MKKKLIIFITILIIGLCIIVCFRIANEDKLPISQASSGVRGEMGIDANINESTIDKYLNRSDSVYYDMRMLKDPANYENIGGDAYLSGFVEGFEVLPYPYLVNVTGIPSEVGNSYQGPTLFTIDDSGNYKANYKESLSILEYFFPKDKYIFLMCGGGGYANMTKKLLVYFGWNEDKIYNVGGYWYYEGENNITIKREVDGNTYYDFYKVSYHNIDFEFLEVN